MKKSEEIRERLNQLRKEMEKEGVDTLMIPTADYHNSEYAAEYFFRVHRFGGNADRLEGLGRPLDRRPLLDSGRAGDEGHRYSADEDG